MNHGIQQGMCVNFAIVWGPFGPQQMLAIWPTKAGTLEIEPGDTPINDGFLA